MLAPSSDSIAHAISMRENSMGALVTRMRALDHERPLAHADGWESALMGIGTPDDAIASMKYSGFVNVLPDSVLEAMFMTEPFSERGVTAYPDIAFSEGVTYQGVADVDAAREFLDETWRVPEVCTLGLIWGRLYGGAVTWIVTDRDVDQCMMPLDPGEEVIALRNVERMHVVADSVILDPAGCPVYWRVVPPEGGRSALVHSSRLVFWKGDLTPQRRRIQRGYWDMSVLQRAFDVLKREGLVSQSAMQLLKEASLGVLSIKDLWSAVTQGNLGTVRQRIRLFNATRAQSRAIVLDKDKEAFDRVNTTFAGVADIMDRGKQMVSMAFRIPVTILMGEAPAGLNATGDADTRAFLKNVASYQKRDVEPGLAKLCAALLNSKGSPCAAEGLTISWPPLWEPTAKEAAEIYSTTAQADCALLDRDVITPEQAKSRFKPEGYSQQIDVSTDDADEGSDDVTDPADLLGTSEGGTTPDGGTPVQATAMNGAQVSSLVEVVQATAKKELPRDSAIEIIMLAFQVDRAKAEALIGSAGLSFTVEPPPTPAPFGGGGAPQPTKAKPPEQASSSAEQEPAVSSGESK